MNTLAIFNGKRMVELSPNALVSDLSVICDDIMDLDPDTSLIEQVKLPQNTPVKISGVLTALYVQNKSQNFSTIGINPIRVGSSPGSHIVLHNMNTVHNSGTDSDSNISHNVNAACAPYKGNISLAIYKDKTV